MKRQPQNRTQAFTYYAKMNEINLMKRKNTPAKFACVDLEWGNKLIIT